MKKAYYLSILTLLMIVMTAGSALAVSDAAVLYLRVAAGARPGGMGEAFVSIADDATATYWNPAGLGNTPIAGEMTTMKIPARLGEISDVVTVHTLSGIESWFIADGKLVKFNGKSWSTGKDYLTSSDQNLYDFVKSIIAFEDQEQVEKVAQRIVEINCSITPDEIDHFISTARSHIPAEYKDAEMLERGLDTLVASYKLCLLRTEQFRDLRNKLDNGMKDSTMTNQEMDRITFSIESAINRFLPSKLSVPYTASIDGTISDLGVTGKQYIWVATDNGLYRLSGQVWARYDENNGLPSKDIVSLGYSGDLLLIGTAQGLAKYYHGGFETISDVPGDRVSAVTMQNSMSACAVVGGQIYMFDGATWKNTYDYIVRLDDSIENIARRAAIYKTPAEIEYLSSEIRRLNGTMTDRSLEEGETNVADIMAEDMIMKESIGEGTSDEMDTAEEMEGIGEGTSDEMDMAEEMEGIGEGMSDEMDMAEEMEGPAGVDSWLVEGAVIKVPYCAPLRFDVNVVMIDLTGSIWVGTTSGLLSFDGNHWINHGYDVFTAPTGTDENGETKSWTAQDIARKYLPRASDETIGVLADNIDEYNDLNGQSVEPGQSVFVYNWNTGAEIYSIGMVVGEMYVGTEYGLERRVGSGWESVDFQNLDKRKVIAAYDYDGASYYISSEGVTMESKGLREFVLMHVNWLPSLNLDIYYDFASYVHNVRGLGTFGLSIIYLNYGTIARTGEGGEDLGEINPFEIAIGASFGTSISSKLKWGMTGRFIHSRLSPQGTAQEQGNGIASTFSVDMGILYKITKRFQLGTAITNVGPDITYIDADQSDALPRNFAFGLSYKVWDTPYNSIVVQGELNKMLVNLHKGFGTELEYAIRHFGFEYWYANFIAIRAGYKYDKEGQVKHMTFGAGLKLVNFRLDFAYVPSSIDSPLANTLRISFTGSFN